MAGDGDKLTILVGDLDPSCRTAALHIDLGDGIGDGDRVAEEDRLQKSDLVIPHRNGGFRCLSAMRYHLGRDSGHESNKKRAMRHQATIARFLHVDPVDMVWREIAGNTGKLIDIALGDCLGEAGVVANVEIKIRHPIPPLVSVTLTV